MIRILIHGTGRALSTTRCTRHLDRSRYAANGADRPGLEEVGRHIFRDLAVFNRTIRWYGGVQYQFIRLVGAEFVCRLVWSRLRHRSP